MEPMRIDEVLAAAGGALAAGGAEGAVGAVCIDSRRAQPGGLFIALKGGNFDGHDYIPEALRKGCRAVVFSRPDVAARAAARGIALIRVADTLDALARIAQRHRSRFELPLVAVTGSNGKTTTKEMIRAIAAARFSVLASEGTFNNFVGVPLTLLRIEAWHTLAVLELGMNARGEIRRLAEIAAPDVGVVTNVGPAHLEFLETVENVAAAKAELLDAMTALGRGRTAVLNLDDPRVAAMDGRAGLAVRTFGLAEGADVRGEEVRAVEGGVSFRMRFMRAGRAVAATLPVLGLHNVSNALAAAAVCEALGMEPEEIAAAMRGVRLPPMRMEPLSCGGVTFINDAYNANPASMRAAVETLAATRTSGRRILAVGGMLELGAASEEAHRGIGTLAAERGIDALIAVGPLGASAADAAEEAGMPASSVVRCAGVGEAAEALRAMAWEGDVVLLKASRRVGLEKVLEGWRRPGGGDGRNAPAGGAAPRR